MRKQLVRRDGWCTLLVGVVFVVGPALASRGQPAQHAKDSPAPTLTEFQQRQVGEHLQLLKALEQGKSVAPEYQFEHIYKPIAYVCKRDFEKSKALVEQLAEKITEIQEKDSAKASEYTRLAKAYKQYAECNLAAVKAYEAKDTSKMRLAVDAVLEAGKSLTKVTGKPVQRDWFTPRETEWFITLEQERQRKAGKG